MKPILKSRTSLAGAGVAAAVILSGCVAIQDALGTETAATEETTEAVETVVEEATETAETMVQEVKEDAKEMTSQATLATVLAAQPDTVQARYGARNPAETMAFFGIEPGMTVAEALPGGGWYSKILISYLGEEGTLIGAHYPDNLWPMFGFGEEWAAGRGEATANWPTQAAEWGVDGAAIGSTVLTAMPEDASGQVDAVLFIRALHNLNRFTSEENDFMGDTLAETYRVLKPGGVVGVVQHSGPEGNSDEWATGANGYLKESAVIAAFEAAGFELAASSDINANADDVPSNEDFVWRLPPSLSGTEDGTPERAAMEAIGESNRMTLKFVKPA